MPKSKAKGAENCLKGSPKELCGWLTVWFCRHLPTVGSPPLLLLAAGLLFALSFPSTLIEQGSPLLVFVFAWPLLGALEQLKSLRQALLYGAFYGFSSYLLLSLWLLTYDWIAFILVPGIYLCYFSAFFAASFALRRCLAKYRLPNWLNYGAFVLCWALLEYVKSTGWVAYTYGSLLYSQYRFPAAMYFSRNFGLQNLAYLLLLGPAICLHLLFPLKHKACLGGQSKKRTSTLLAMAALCVASLHWIFAAYIEPLAPDGTIPRGIPSQANYSAAQAGKGAELRKKATEPPMPISRARLNVALLQHNINSWQTEEDTSVQALVRLLQLSRRAEQANAELVIWSETAFVPIYRFHRDRELDSAQGSSDYSRSRRREVLLSHKLRDYLNEAKATYLIGTNDYGQPDLFPQEQQRDLYNAMLVVQHGQIIGTYHKQRLVPFTETPKWEDWLPSLNHWLQQQGFAQYSAGKGSPILTVPLTGKRRLKLRIYTMICYEDSLPLYWPHRLLAPATVAEAIAQKNFDLLLSVSNDSWSSSPIGGLQHLSSSVSRAVEFGKYFLRGSTSGQTAIIGPQGQIIQSLPANVAGILYFRLPL